MERFTLMYPSSCDINAVLGQEAGVPSGVGGGSKKRKDKFFEYEYAHIRYARENRKHETKAERLFRWMVRKKGLAGYKFTRQKTIGSFILDFYCSKLLLGIEIDGSSHDQRQEYDQSRTNIIARYGIKIIRYANEDVLYYLESVEKDLSREMALRAQELANPSEGS